MQGKTVVITGGTSGIGQAAAERLAAMGARIVLIARDQDRAAATLAHLKRIAPAAAHGCHLGDLSRIADTKRLAAAVAAAEPRIDVLINNAGAMFTSRQVTADGLERTFAINHMAYFVFTEGLRGKLIASAPARIVNTASIAHMGKTLDFDDLQSEREFGWQITYGRSKLANILFTRELARRLAGTGVTVNCLHPGVVATRIVNNLGGAMWIVGRIAKLFFLSPEKGAETLVYLASSPEVEGKSGGYYDKCKLIDPSAEARDEASARRLWEISERLAARAA